MEVNVSSREKQPSSTSKQIFMIIKRLPIELIVLTGVVSFVCILLLFFHLPEARLIGPPHPVQSPNPNQVTILHEAYKANLEALNSNMLFQAIVVIAATFVATKGSGKLVAPIINIELPVKPLHVLLPLVLLSLWLLFGFKLDELIEDRIAAWHILRDMGDSLDNHPGSQLFVFQDGAFLDTYFSNFSPDYLGFRPVKSIVVSVMFLWGILLACTHACILGLILIAKHRYFNTSAAKICCSVLFWLAVIVLIASNYAFAYLGRPNPNWLSFFIAAITLPLLWAAMLFVTRKKRKKKAGPT